HRFDFRRLRLVLRIRLPGWRRLGRFKIDAGVAAQRPVHERRRVVRVQDMRRVDDHRDQGLAGRVIPLQFLDLADAHAGAPHWRIDRHPRRVLEFDVVAVAWALEHGWKAPKKNDQHGEQDDRRQDKDADAEAHTLFIHEATPDAPLRASSMRRSRASPSTNWRTRTSWQRSTSAGVP